MEVGVEAFARKNAAEPADTALAIQSRRFSFSVCTIIDYLFSPLSEAKM